MKVQNTEKMLRTLGVENENRIQINPDMWVQYIQGEYRLYDITPEGINVERGLYTVIGHTPEEAYAYLKSRHLA